jgi:diguanylate cyclase
VVAKSEEHLKQWSGYGKQLKAWSELLSNLTMEQESEVIEEESTGGFFSRFFQQKPAPEVLAPTQEIIEHTVEADSTTPGYDHIEQEISTMLTRLLHQLVIPSRYHHRLENLKKKLTSKLNWYELVPLLEQVANLIIDALGDGQEEFEQFLQGLDSRLETIQQLVNHASQGQVERSEARSVFEGMLEGQVDEIRSVVNGQNDLGELGQSISQHLGLIIQAMHTFSSGENTRETELTHQLADMQTKLDEMEKLAELAQHAIEEQRKKAMHDALTGLPNREAYQQRVEQEMHRIERYGGSLSLMVCDIDLFKRINDNYGHLAGDKVLKIISKSLQRNLRDSDFIARFGGEEFVALMPETSAKEARIVAEKLRKKIESSPFNFKKEPVQITVSFGISEFAKGETIEEVFSRADKALYKAKDDGRNQVQLG